MQGRTVSIGEILDRHKGAGPGFDALRLFLALSILASHCSGLTGNAGYLSRVLLDIYHLFFSAAQATGLGDSTDVVAAVGQGTHVTGMARPYVIARVPMFFALSGFLVTGSAYRTRSLVRFLGLRVIRILPALFVEVALSAILLGGIFTTLPLSQYYTSSGFYAYFLNIIGWVHLTLPEVFAVNNYSNVVNGNLWTLPSEFDCYAISALLIATGILFNRIYFTCIFAAASVPLAFASLFYGFGEISNGLNNYAIVYYFFMGVTAYLWRDKLPYSWRLFVPALIVTLVLMQSTRTAFVATAFLTYVTVFIGMSPLPQSKLLKSGDYSYGVYLYGAPIIQAFIATAPVLKEHLLLLLALSVTATCLFSFASWHLVEKRFNGFKKYLSPRSAEIAEALRHGQSPAGPGGA